MELTEFWNIIEIGKDSDEPENVLKEELNKLGAEEVASFQKHFEDIFDKADAWNLWGAAYLIGGGCSDDGFIDFRYALISMGKSIYEKAIADPDSLASLGRDIEIDNELFGYVAGTVYEEKTGEEIPVVENISYQETAGEDWDFDDEAENKKRLPKLTELYW